MDDDPFSGWGLRLVELADKAVIDPYLDSLSQPLSDYTFSQLFTWRNSLRILWKEVRGNLCVFANGSGDLTLLIPPIGDSGGDAALTEAMELMDAYNACHGVPFRTRVEYVSTDLLRRFSLSKLEVQPMGPDYVYDLRQMIDLPGSALASKRQAKNRFLRLYEHRVEPYCAARHLTDCKALLDSWKDHQDAHGPNSNDGGASARKRAKESTATALCLEYAERLGLRGIVVYVKNEQGQWPLAGFTFGEWLGQQQSSITIEKTDLAIKGLAQFIFSEFCRTHWAERPLVNVGDDWGLETLAWTKQSYRPVEMLEKFSLQPRTVRGRLFQTSNLRFQTQAAV